MSDYTTSIWMLFFPLSYAILLCGITIGILLTFVTSSYPAISLLAIGILLFTGCLRITPILSLFHRLVVSLFPDTYTSAVKNLRESFQLQDIGKHDHTTRGLYVFHPHGVCSVAMLYHTATHFTDWPTRTISTTIKHTFYNAPCIPEVTEGIYTPSTYTAMKKVLEGGKSLAVALGGAEEIIHTRPGAMKLLVTPRKGVFKMALETGTPLIPVLTYGENEAYSIYRSPFLDSILRLCVEHGIFFFIPTVDSLWQWLGIASRPLKTPLRTVLGAAVPVVQQNATDDKIAALKATYIAALRSLYAETRPSDYQEELEIV